MVHRKQISGGPEKETCTKNGRFQIDKHSAMDVAARTCCGEKRVAVGLAAGVRGVAACAGGIAHHAVRLDAVLGAVEFPLRRTM